MLVTLDATVFQTDTLVTDVIQILLSAEDERHVVSCDPPYDPAANEPVNQWLNRLPEIIRAPLTLILEQGNELRAMLVFGTSEIRVVSDAARVDWGRGWVIPSQAKSLLGTPLRLLLEDQDSDLRFLVALAPPTQRTTLQRLIRRGWIVPEHGGGTGGMRNRLRALIASRDELARVNRLRLFVMFDRDSNPADRSLPSEVSDQLLELCTTGMPIDDPWRPSVFRLGRRTIESYLPLVLLYDWAGNQDRLRERVEALAVLRRDRPLAAWQYNMKNGLLGDVIPNRRLEIRRAVGNIARALPQSIGRALTDADLDPLFAGFDDRVRGALALGFGDDVADQYLVALFDWDGHFQREYDRGPGDQPDRLTVIDSIFARL